MQIYSQLAPLALGGAHGSAVAMGFFDGIHIGHRAVINGAVEWARAHGAAPAVFTFRLPTENKMKGKRLLSTEDKHALIASLGVEHYLCPDFEEIKAMTPEQFVLGIIRDCNARALFCGENFTFGARAAGTPELLRPASAPRWKAVTSRRPMPCWGCPTPSASQCITGRALAGRWACRPSISSTRRASSCPGTASISPVPG